MKKSITLLTLAIVAIASSAFISTSETSRKLPKLIRKNYAYIPSGKVVLEKDTAQVPGFFMAKTEVTNIAYREFLAALKRDGKTEELQLAQLDTAKWIINGKHIEPFAKVYHKHPAYESYPVVTMSKEGAVLYCKWLGKILTQNNPGFVFDVRLPTRQEWVRAARPSQPQARYAWGGPYLRNNRGQFLANFRHFSDASIAYDAETNNYVIKDIFADGVPVEHMHITAPARAYFPSESGLYQMNGNVAELTADGLACGGSWNSPGYDIRNESVVSFEGPSPLVGFRPVLVVRVMP